MLDRKIPFCQKRGTNSSGLSYLDTSHAMTLGHIPVVVKTYTILCTNKLLHNTPLGSSVGILLNVASGKTVTYTDTHTSVSGFRSSSGTKHLPKAQVYKVQQL